MLNSTYADAREAWTVVCSWQYRQLNRLNQTEHATFSILPFLGFLNGFLFSFLFAEICLFFGNNFLSGYQFHFPSFVGTKHSQKKII
jgi:hypothetical protein